jgi:hypothetical protein
VRFKATAIPPNGRFCLCPLGNSHVHWALSVPVQRKVKVESNQAKPRELVPGGNWPAAGARKKVRYFSENWPSSWLNWPYFGPNKAPLNRRTLALQNRACPPPGSGGQPYRTVQHRASPTAPYYAVPRFPNPYIIIQPRASQTAHYYSVPRFPNPYIIIQHRASPAV